MTTHSDGSPRWRSALALAIAAVAVSALLNIAIARRLGLSRERTEASEATLSAVAALRAHLVDAETGQRGYLLTGDTAYLDPYRSARAKVRADLDSLASRIGAVDSNGTTRQMTALATRKLDELDQTVRLFDRGSRDSALAIVRSNRGKAVMDSVRTLARSLSAGERTRLTDERQSEQTLASSVLVTLLGGAALLVGVLLYLWTTLRDYEASQRAAQREMNLQLKDLELVMRQHAAAAPRADASPSSRGP